MLAGWLEQQAARGLIRCPDPMQTAELLLALTIAEPLRQMALGLTPPLPDSDLGAHPRGGGLVLRRPAAALIASSACPTYKTQSLV